MASSQGKSVLQCMTVVFMNVVYLGPVGLLVFYRGKEEKTASSRKVVLHR